MSGTYGRLPSEKAYQRRQFIHEHIVAQRSVAHALPTNVRAIYYVGKDSAWPGDAGGGARQSSQYVSEAVSWLIDRGLVGEDEVMDANGHNESSLGVVDLLEEAIDYASLVALCPWSPNAVPVLIAEGRNDLALLRPIGEARRISWIALGGMAQRGHLRRVATEEIGTDAPIGYVGDWGRSGKDIERNAEKMLRRNGWEGTWTRLLITDAQAAKMSPKTVLDRRDGKSGPSLETAQVPVADARAVIHAWLDSLLPAHPDADESMRDEIVAALDALR